MTEKTGQVIHRIIRRQVDAGGYRVGRILFVLPEKPSAWRRFWALFLLGWRWEDGTDGDPPLGWPQ